MRASPLCSAWVSDASAASRPSEQRDRATPVPVAGLGLSFPPFGTSGRQGVLARDFGREKVLAKRRFEAMPPPTPFPGARTEAASRRGDRLTDVIERVGEDGSDKRDRSE